MYKKGIFYWLEDPSRAWRDIREWEMRLRQSIPENPPLYLVIDLSGGHEAASFPFRFSQSPPDISSDLCRTEELWLRRIPAGTFVMGALQDESPISTVFGKWAETCHLVILTHDFYIGVFEVTQRQWQLITGEIPTKNNGTRKDIQTQMDDMKPVTGVSYLDIRGTQKGALWPSGGHAVDDESFMGRLFAKTGLEFDLPTEAQWEYACRAGWNGAFNAVIMNELGQHIYNKTITEEPGTVRVGSFKPNDWGLYDMHGNVAEWCLDWASGKKECLDSIDPAGLCKKKYHVYRAIRGGGFDSFPQECRSAARNGRSPHQGYESVGVRIVCNLPDDFKGMSAQP